MNLPANPNIEHFPPVLQLIQQAKLRVLSTANQQLLELYWQIGEYLSLKVVEQVWGQGTVKDLAKWLAEREPNLHGFSAQNLWRMRQFNEAYAQQPKLSPLVRVLSWTHNLLILSKCKTEEVRGFYAGCHRADPRRPGSQQTDSRHTGSQAPACEPRSRSSSFARREAGASNAEFPSWSLGTSEKLESEQ